jgi:hypothetical protein
MSRYEYLPLTIGLLPQPQPGESSQNNIEVSDCPAVQLILFSSK